jgi:hypothetical protein
MLTCRSGPAHCAQSACAGERTADGNTFNALRGRRLHIAPASCRQWALRDGSMDYRHDASLFERTAIVGTEQPGYLRTKRDTALSCRDAIAGHSHMRLL